MTRLRNHGMVREPGAFVDPVQALAADGTAHPWYYEMAELGFNHRVSDLQCALGLSQLTKLERFAARRRHLVALYDARLAPLAPRVRPLERTAGLSPAWHLYVVRIDFEAWGTDRDRVMRRLSAAGIGTQVHYIPVPWQPYYRERYGTRDLPGAAAYYRRALSLPLSPAMADPDVDRVVAALEDALSG
jgi:dTDP-4-amino-4,6-dideoxygalactose transaminase